MANTFFDKWVDNRNNLTEDLRPNDPRRAAGDAILDDLNKRKRERQDAADARAERALRLKEREADRGEGRNPKQKRRDFYRENKARRKAEKSRKADAKARTARAKMEEAVYGKNFKNVTAEGKLKPKTKKEQKAAHKASKKAIRTDKRARVAEAVAQRQLSKKGGEAAGPKRPKREKKNLGVLTATKGRGVLRPGKRLKLDVRTTVANIKDDITSGERKARRQRNTKARHEFQLKRRRYRQTQGLRGDINVRRKAKGKDAI